MPVSGARSLRAKDGGEAVGLQSSTKPDPSERWGAGSGRSRQQRCEELSRAGVTPLPQSPGVPAGQWPWRGATRAERWGRVSRYCRR